MNVSLAMYTKVLSAVTAEKLAAAAIQPAPLLLPPPLPPPPSSRSANVGLVSFLRCVQYHPPATEFELSTVCILSVRKERHAIEDQHQPARHGGGGGCAHICNA